MAGREASIRAVLLAAIVVLGTGAGAQEPTPTDVPATATPTATPPARYWVGGSGAWDDPAHWSTTSGGAGGASSPGSRSASRFPSAPSAGA